jgi:hypothetical protein
MHNIYSPTAFNSKEFECTDCNWKGEGRSTEQEHLILTDAIELYCPSCQNYLGFVSQNDMDFK